MALTVGLVAATEIVARLDGDVANHVPDTWARWARARQQATDVGNRGVVVLGTSRAHQGTRLAPFRARWPECVAIQLSQNAHWPTMTVLDDLANDPNVSGLVILEFFPGGAFVASHMEGYSKTQWQGERQEIKTLLETPLDGLWDRLATVQNPDYSWIRLLRFATGSGPGPGDLRKVQSNADREVGVDYSLIDPAMAHSAAVVGNYAQMIDVVSKDQAFIDSIFSMVAADAAAIHAHGGQLIVVRYPSAFAVREVEEQVTPRKRYWDPLKKMPDVLTIDYIDEPTLARFDCGDTHHLDQKDALPFSQALVAVIARALANREGQERWK